jgi:hypothetical protein
MNVPFSLEKTFRVKITPDTHTDTKKNLCQYQYIPCFAQNLKYKSINDGYNHRREQIPVSGVALIFFYHPPPYKTPP